MAAFVRKATSCSLGLSLIVISTVGILLSLSRGAFVSALFALVGCALILSVRASFKPLALLALAVFILAASLLFAPESTRERISTLTQASQTESGQTRLQSWKDSLHMWRDFPILGAGAESFRTTYPLYQTINTRKTLYYAENEYVQWLVEFGLLGMALMATLVITLLHRLFRFWSVLAMWQRLTFTWVFLASAAHCFLDFPLRHPTNAVILILMIAISLTPLKTTPRRTNKELSKRTQPSPSNTIHLIKRHTTKVAYLAIALICFYGLSHGTNLWRLDSAEYLTKESPRDSIKNALNSAPTYPLAWSLLGNNVRQEISSKIITLKQQFILQDIALTCYNYNANYNPSNYVAWMALGKVAYEWDDDSTAQKAFQNAVDLRPYLLRDIPIDLNITSKDSTTGG
ncbi:O-antigen ligase family protein [Rubellicoccus peritrichatus]|uniref:O-antigen ligase family protein n=1 Tax=Rubellicoccus peritrichatus TaxID=3080537 RepID=A0AAQ3L982_9BACT|nr:O-antigen ligase family protein [Puniceicoccus sp. CR14]WOO41421.1 O-antigen ligase family protein [Puniceicoccus sp. CR14]